jgi:hypothetical protein
VPASFRTCCFKLVQGRRDRAVLGHPVGGRDEAVHPVPEGHGAEPLLGLADFGHHGIQRLRRRGQLHLAQQRLDPGGLTGEADAEQLAHRAAAAVAADEVARAQLRAVGQLDGHPMVVLAQPDQFAAASNLDAEFDGVLDQQALDGGLWDTEDVGMCGVQPVRPRLVDAGEETTDRALPAEREEPLQETALVHHLDAARVQAERADDPGRLRLLLQHEHVHAVQPQLAGQHQAGRSAAGNDHVDHENPIQQGCMSASCSAQSGGAHTREHTHFANPDFRRFWLRPGFCGTTRVLPQGPRCAIR